MDPDQSFPVFGRVAERSEVRMLRARTDPIRSLRPTFLEMGKDCCVILERTWGMEVMLNPIDEARTAVDTKRIAGKEISRLPESEEFGILSR
jgi:hypothetical protein